MNSPKSCGKDSVFVTLSVSREISTFFCFFVFYQVT